MAKNYLNLPDRMAISDVIRAHGKKGDDGFWDYDEGWSDARVLSEMIASGMKVTETNVVNTRVALGYKMRARAASPVFNDMIERLGAMEKRVALLEQQLARTQESALKPVDFLGGSQRALNGR